MTAEPNWRQIVKSDLCCRPRCIAIPILAVFLLYGVWGSQQAVAQQTPAPETAAPEGQAAANPNYERLGESSVAERLNLTDEQKAKIAELLKKRAEALQSAEGDAAAKVVTDSNTELAAVLNDEQKAAFANLKPIPKLRFNFRYQRWADVLQWFAEQADLSLVMDAPPPATFNYTDNKEYTPTEAIDLLNGVLLTKDFTLIRRGRMLVVIDMKDGIPQDLIPRIDLKDLEERGKHEFVSVMFPLGKRNAQEVDAEIKQLLGTHGSSVPLPKTQQILVTATAGNMRAIGAVIESIPEPAPPKPQPKPPEPEKPELRNYPTKSVDPGAAVELINQLVTGIKVVADDKAEQLNVYATPSQHAAVAGVLEKMQTEHAPDKQPRLELYPIGQGDHEELLETLKLVVPDATLRIDEGSKQILAWASPQDHQKLTDSLKKIGAGGLDRDSAQLSVYPLTEADPTSTQELLRTIVPNARISYDAGSKSLVVVAVADDQRVIKTTLDQLQPEQPGPNTPVLQFYPFEDMIPTGLVGVLQGLVPNAKITEDNTEKRLMVTATPADHRRIADTIKKFPTTAERGKKKLVIYQVTPAQRKRFQAVVGSITGDLPGIQIITDAEPGELAVWAREGDHETLKTILDGLKREVPEEDQFTLTSYPVEASRQTQAVSVLQRVYPGMDVISDPTGARLLVCARPADHEKLAETLKKVLAEAGEEHQPRFESYPILAADPNTLTPMLTALLPTMRLSVDAASKKIIAWGTPEEHGQLKSALAKMTGGSPQTTPQIEVYPLTKAEPTTTQTLLQGLFPAARLTFDPQTRSLVVVAVPADQQAIRATLEQLQPDAPGPTDAGLHFIPLEEPPQASLTNVLQTLVPRAQVTYDAEDKRLMVVATEADFELVQQTVNKMLSTALPAEKNKLEIYPVTPAQRTRFQAILDTVQSELPGMRVITDAEPGELAIWAKPSQHAVLAEVIEKMRREVPEEQQYELLPYQLKLADPANTLTVMQQLFPQVKIVLDSKTRKLLIWAPPALQEKIRETLERIDSGAAADIKESYKVYPIYESEPGSILNLLQQQLPGVRFVNDANSKAIIAWANARDHKEIQETLKQVVVGLDPERKRKLVVYPAGRSDSANLMRGLRQLFPDARIDDDSSSNSIMVWGTPEEHKNISDAMQTIAENSKNNTLGKMVIYKVKREVASSTQQLLQQAVPRARIILGGDPLRIIAWASEDEHAEITSIIRQIAEEATGGEPRITTIYDLEGVDASAVMSLIGDILRRETQFITSQNGERLIVRAKQKHQQEIDAAIKMAKEKLPKVEKPTAHVYRIKHVNPNNLISVLNPIVPGVPMVPNVRERTLTITATATQHDKLAKTIEKVDVEPTGDNLPYLKSYQVKRADTGVVYGVVSNILSGSAEVQLSYDARNGTLIAFAHPEQHKKIAETIADIEKDIVGAKPEVYPLGTADPNVAASFLRTITPRAEITVDNVNRSLVINAVDADHERIKAAIEKIEAAPEGEASAYMKSYQIKHADPGTVYGMVNQMLSGHSEVRLSFDPANGAVILYALPAQHEKVVAMIADIEQGIAGATSEVYRFRTADPNAAVPILQQLVPRARLSVDNRNRSLVVNATAADHKKIADTIAKMDAEENDGNGAIIKAYPVQTAEPSNLLSMLQTNFALQPDIRLSADYKNETIIATATPAQHEKIAAFIAEVDKQGRVRTTELYRFRRADPNVASGVLRPLFPKAIMAVDNNNRSLLVTATPEEHKEIQLTIEKMNSTENTNLNAELRSYPVKNAEPNNLLNMLQVNFALQPDVRLSLDQRNDTIMALALPEQHEKIAAFIERVEQGGQSRRAEVYRFRIADPNAAINVLRVLTPKAQMAVDMGSRSLVVTATESDHEKIAETIKEMDSDVAEGTGPQLRSYPVENAQVNTLAQAIQSAYRNRPDVQVTYDSRNNTVAAVAPAAEHAKIQEFIEESDKQGVQMVSRVYRFENADPQAALRVLRSLTPRADAAVDDENHSLVVSASESDHKKIQQTVDAMDGDGASSFTPVLKVYPLSAADGSSLQSTLRAMFRRYREVEVSYDRDNESIIALAPPKTQIRIAEMVEEVEQASGADPRATLRVYTLKTVDARTAVDVLENATNQLRPKIKLSMNRQGRQIAVVAHPEQHELIEKTLEQMDDDKRVLEVYQLEFVEPFTAELSIDRLFGGFDFDDPTAPIVDSDENMQKLFIRALPEQQEQIRELLVKMGETQLQARSVDGKKRRMRIIPFKGDTDAAVKEIQRVWPQLRKNNIRIVTPSAVMPTMRRIESDDADEKKDLQELPQPGAGQFAVPAEELPEQVADEAKPAESADEDQSDEEQEQSQDDEPQAADEEPSKENEANATSPAPIIVAPGDGRITIASDDPDALDQFESLLRAMSSSEPRAGGYGKEFVVFSLRYTSAVQAAQTLQQFFDTGRRRGGNRNGFSRFSSSSSVTIVADERLNAVIVHANRNEREMIEDLLEVLDSKEIPESLASNKPRLIPVKNTEASRIEQVLRSIYKSALTTGGGGPPIPVPTGVSKEVAAAIQSVNAAAQTPLLTLEVDERTNSLVVMAPTNLFEEIEELVEEMDNAAIDDSARRLKVIQLKRLNTRSLEQSLDMLIDNDSRRRRTRRRRD